ncbi:MAG: carbohydrate kinase family protein [Chloroflexi bacterium]|nr:MAG: carbohydrate kinase family protein [Chloroflexota bacterium]
MTGAASVASGNPDVWVIGTASLDVLHFAGQTVHTIGGAGLYTALAVRRAGGRAGLFAPRPRPMPAALQPLAEHVYWVGPEISPDDLPRLEIAHHGEGRATLLNASWGAEARLLPDDLPPEIWSARVVHIAALSSARRQLAFADALRRGGSSPRSPLLSAGTYARLVFAETDSVLQLISESRFFFMNENEARGLFGRLEDVRSQPGQTIFVTLGAEGARVFEAQKYTSIPAVPADELDPTGAGDTFCGAVLASLSRGLPVEEAARLGVRLAAQTISAPGPAALLGK